jgi:hypothetical protein
MPSDVAMMSDDFSAIGLKILEVICILPVYCVYLGLVVDSIRTVFKCKSAGVVQLRKAGRNNCKCRKLFVPLSISMAVVLVVSVGADATRAKLSGSSGSMCASGKGTFFHLVVSSPINGRLALFLGVLRTGYVNKCGNA